MAGINARHLLIVSLGYNEYLHEEIERLYEKKRWEYYEIFKNSGFYNDMVINSFSPIREDKMKKVAGIVEWCYKYDDFTLINMLINKGYKNAVRYFQQKKRNLDIQEFKLLGQYPAYLMFNPILYVIGAAYDRLVCTFNVLAFLRGWLLCVLVKNHP